MIYRHNWASSFELSQSYSTVVFPSIYDGSEERLSTRNIPLHTITIKPTALRKSELNQLIKFISEGIKTGLDMPISCDETYCNSSLTAGLNVVIPCVTTNRRFKVGKKVLLATSTSYDYATITAKTDSSLTIDALPSNLSNFSVFPVIKTLPPDEGSISALTNSVAETVLTFEEDPRSPLGELPEARTAHSSGLLKADEAGIPYFLLKKNVWNNGIVFDIEKENQSFSIGEARYSPVDDLKRIKTSVEFTFIDRYDVFYLLNLFQNRKGRAYSFWTIPQISMPSILGYGSGIVSIEPVPNTTVQEFKDTLEYVALLDKDDSVEIRKIENVSDLGSFWRLSLEAPFSIVPTEILPCYLSRFNSDFLSEDWTTTKICNVSCEFVGVPNDQVDRTPVIDAAPNVIRVNNLGLQVLCPFPELVICSRLSVNVLMKESKVNARATTLGIQVLSNG